MPVRPMGGLALAFALGTLLLANTASAKDTLITIGTGGPTGVYYNVGQSVCRLVNLDTAKSGIKCTATSTDGSVTNVNAIRDGSMNLGVVQSDVQYNAYNGVDQFAKTGPFKELRAVFSIHPEPFTVLARAGSGIRTFEDLKGKRVNVGNPGSGQRATMEVVMNTIGWTMDDFALASELDSAEQAQALCDNDLDAIVFTVGHPNGSIQEATTTCDAVLVPVAAPAIDKLVEENPYYSKAVIPGGMYAGNPDDVATFGVRATLVSSTASEPDTIYEVVKAVFDNFDRFKKLHPAFATLQPEDMIKVALSAPLHEGAQRYYQEQGWQ
ncbi:MAG: TAXI family TRAP transporter solute-binding subunit [Geminicoccaceae bacterium]